MSATLLRSLVALPRLFRRAPVVVGLVLALVVGLGAGAAWAYFSSSGTGSGAATVGHVTQVTVVTLTGTTASPKLQPGSHGDLKLKVTNPNHFSVTITHVVGKSGTITATGAKGTCTGATSGISVPAKTISYTVANGTHTITIATGALMSATSPTGCQGATFSIPVTIAVEQR